jgi:hypothetical protein
VFFSFRLGCGKLHFVLLVSPFPPWFVGAAGAVGCILCFFCCCSCCSLFGCFRFGGGSQPSNAFQLGRTVQQVPFQSSSMVALQFNGSHPDQLSTSAEIPLEQREQRV